MNSTPVTGADGIYLNETFMHRVTSLIGLEVEVNFFYNFLYILNLDILNNYVDFR